MDLAKIIDLPSSSDGMASQCELSHGDAIPFEIKRVYYIYGTAEGVSRGYHAHKSLSQVAVCIAGQCLMRMSDGERSEDVWLDSPTKGLLIEDMVWREMHNFSEDCILLVLASKEYSELDYIRDYGVFLDIVRAQ